ncbi:diaminopimelate decarboxylase [Paeniglutamicibacter kerguelensis]|uniref:Diaminopimelate decarboxylase n=1 Tax=Paeniglutamicibacter kerguelensis TaxID=254788 RepID=A0ABS4XGG0_9MICC|nr:diaminopimelate decarboxylase [Paeniglutamicibacter kerguelensis]
MTQQAAPSVDLLMEILPEESTISDTGELSIGGVPVTELARQYGTPAYIMDETGLRRQIRRFVDGISSRRPNSEVLFASKSLPCVAMYAIAQAEGLSVDVAGGGELMMALTAGVSPERIYLHGNAKSNQEIQMALEAGIRAIIVDNFDDLDRIEKLAAKPQKVLLRMIPGITPATHASQVTGGNDSKFGLPPADITRAIARIEAHPMLEFEGIHVHIGSQVLETEPFAAAVRSVAEFGSFSTYDVGGGLGVKYTYDEVAPSVDSYLDTITEAADRLLPADAKLIIEPGRSIVARAGITLYTVNTVKTTGKTFVAVNGGMADNMDIALTGQRYEALLATKIGVEPTVVADVVGRQCESGDLMCQDVALPDPQVGDLVVMPATGAYAYTLANNYNGACKPPVIFCADGSSTLAVARETYEDLLHTQQPALQRRW